MNLFTKQSNRCRKQSYGFWGAGRRRVRVINWKASINVNTPLDIV